MNRETKITILQQGEVRLTHDVGYMVLGDGDAVCFNIDVDGWADIEGAGTSTNDCPVLYLACAGDCQEYTSVELSEFPGWRFHAGNSGNTLAVALVRRGIFGTPRRD